MPSMCVSCFPFAYCAQAPEANCANAPTFCYTTCSAYLDCATPPDAPPPPSPPPPVPIGLLTNISWAIAVATGAGYQEGTSIASDGAGGVYITGVSRGIAAFGSVLLTSDMREIYVARVSSVGDVLWAIRAGSRNLHDSSYGIAPDGEGGALLVGGFAGTTTGAFVLTSCSGNARDAFAARIDSTGGVVWALAVCGSGYDYGRDIVSDGAGGAFVVGNFGGTLSFDSTSLVASGGQDVFVLRVNSLGGIVWASVSGGTGNDFGRGLVSAFSTFY